MAKQKKELDETELEEDLSTEDGQQEKPRKKGKLIGIIITAFILALLVAILGFNVGGIRDKYIRKPLEKVPIIKNLLPPLKNEEENGKESEEELSQEQKQIEALTQEIKTLNEEIDRLKVFETNQNQFKTDKEQFDRLVALNDPKAYSSFYEKVSPENAEKLYKEAVSKVSLDKEFKEYISTFENMKKDAASKILEELVLTDIDLVTTILQNLTSLKRADILSAMDPQNAATITKLLSVEKTEEKTT